MRVCIINSSDESVYCQPGRTWPSGWPFRGIGLNNSRRKIASGCSVERLLIGGSSCERWPSLRMSYDNKTLIRVDYVVLFLRVLSHKEKWHHAFPELGTRIGYITGAYYDAPGQIDGGWTITVETLIHALCLGCSWQHRLVLLPSSSWWLGTGLRRVPADNTVRWLSMDSEKNVYSDKVWVMLGEQFLGNW